MTGHWRPAHPGDAPDPWVLAVDERYYGFTTQVADRAKPGWINVPVLTSDDGGSSWNLLGDALPELPSWAVSGNTWAPAVHAIETSFVLYYTVTRRRGGLQSISVATASTPEGPYVDTSRQPLVCQRWRGGSIDPSPFVSPTGDRYLYWKSDDNRRGWPTSLWVQPLTADGRSFAPASSPVRLLRATAPWEHGVIEGPVMTAVTNGDGHDYFLFYGASQWDRETSAIGYATCAGPTGPCTKVTVDAPWLATSSSEVGPVGPAGPAFTVSAGAPYASTQPFFCHGWYGGAPGYANGSVRALWRATVDFRSGRPELVRE